MCLYLHETHPVLCKEWDHTENNLTPFDVTYGSHKKVNWVCKECSHSWKATIKNRAINKTKCPKCKHKLNQNFKKKVTFEKSLLFQFPHIVEEWDVSKNGKSPKEYSPGSEEIVWWVCRKGHSWEATICSRTRRNVGTGCPYCENQKVGYGNDLLTNFPELSKEWHPTKNYSLEPGNVTPGSGRKVWWLCILGHSWEATIANRTSTNKTSCPFCSNNKASATNNLLVKYPTLCEEWDPKKNKSGPEKYLPRSRQKVWWLCKEGHSWKAVIYSRTTKAKVGCPFCAKYNRKASDKDNLEINFPILCKEWDYTKNKKPPTRYTSFSGRKVWWSCTKCGHSWKAVIASRTKGKRGCPLCSRGPISLVSQRWLDSINIPSVFGTTREVTLLIDGQRINVDGLDTHTNTVYEFLGDYWHGNTRVYPENKSNKSVKKTFIELNMETRKRFIKLKNKGYRVVFIWESDFHNGDTYRIFNELEEL